MAVIHIGRFCQPGGPIRMFLFGKIELDFQHLYRTLLRVKYIVQLHSIPQT